ncbi:uncharacterized protein HKW66_Vig0132530 [Vigna angularis]|uniref:S-protein homolog n=1 Tax=Phaseolus angularis TaxID=3914 RepID=A0A8T0K1S1_PHAAN|nr:uncharacterized protein HKW66_Vig0132530 [Vigna angularis]
MKNIISISIHGSVLLLVTLCLMKSSKCSSSDMNRFPSPTISNDTDMNSLFISIASGMSPDDPQVFFFYNNQKDPIYLQPRIPFTKTTNFDRSVIMMYWDVFSVTFYGYDPSTEGNHQKVYWKVDGNGVFHSWDWEKRKTWLKDAS